MRKSIVLGILILANFQFLSAQDNSVSDIPFERVPGLRERAVVMHIVSRIVEQNQQVIWNSENSRTTIPGRPVGIRLQSSDLVVAVQFTPFLRPSGQHILMAQSQIWVSIPNEGVSYQTTMQSIPIEFNEQVYFFPLGSVKDPGEARIEIQVEMEPYSPSGSTSNNSTNTRRNRGTTTSP